MEGECGCVRACVGVDVAAVGAGVGCGAVGAAVGATVGAGSRGEVGVGVSEEQAANHMVNRMPNNTGMTEIRRIDMETPFRRFVS